MRVATVLPARHRVRAREHAPRATTALPDRAARNNTSARRAPRKKPTRTRYIVRKNRARASLCPAVSIALAVMRGNERAWRTAQEVPCASMGSLSLARWGTTRIRLGNQTARGKYVRRATGAITTARTAKYCRPSSRPRHPARRVPTLSVATPNSTARMTQAFTIARQCLPTTTRCAPGTIQISIRLHAQPHAARDSSRAWAFPAPTHAPTEYAIDGSEIPSAQPPL